jgi:hypothetical protein
VRMRSLHMMQQLLQQQRNSSFNLDKRQMQYSLV